MTQREDERERLSRRSGGSWNGRDAPLRILVLSWHPEDGALTAGGFRRATEVVARLSRRAQVVAVDRSPSMFARCLADESQSIEYWVPEFQGLRRLDLRPVRAIQWAIALFWLVTLGWRTHRRHTFHAVYVPTSEILPCVLAGALLAWLTGRPLILCNQNAEGIFLRRAVLALHNRAQAITTVSEALADSLSRAGVRPRIHVTRNGPTLAGRDQDWTTQRKVWDSIFIGRHTPEKGILDALSIWDRVVQGRPGSRLLLVGACSAAVGRRIEQRCRDSARLGGRVVRLGVVPEAEKLFHLRSSRVLIAPSRVEGWGFVPLEALACGVPVVCWDLPAYRESVPDGPGVRRIPVGDIEAFAEAVLELLAQAQENDRLAEWAIVSGARSCISWEDVATQEWQIIAGAVSEPL